MLVAHLANHLPPVIAGGIKQSFQAQVDALQAMGSAIRGRYGIRLPTLTVGKFKEIAETQWAQTSKQLHRSSSQTRGKFQKKSKPAASGSSRPEAKAKDESKTSDTCNYCGKVGHWEKDCRKKKADRKSQKVALRHLAGLDPEDRAKLVEKAATRSSKAEETKEDFPKGA